MNNFGLQRKRKEWWEEEGGFFGRGYMEGDNSHGGYLSAPMSLEERTRTEVEGVVKLLMLQGDQRILDCPCGYGRHSLVLAKRGFQVVGVDINGEELTVACQSADKLTDVQFMKNDMRFLNFSDEFDAVINLFYSFGFFETDEENIRVLHNFFKALKPGGKFLMHTDVNLPRLLQGRYKFEEQRRLHSGRVLRLLDTYDPIQKRINGRWMLADRIGSLEELTPYSVRVYQFEEFEEWCHEVGFKKVVGYGDWQGNSLTENSEDMIVVAEK